VPINIIATLAHSSTHTQQPVRPNEYRGYLVRLHSHRVQKDRCADVQSPTWVCATVPGTSRSGRRSARSTNPAHPPGSDRERSTRTSFSRTNSPYADKYSY